MYSMETLGDKSRANGNSKMSKIYECNLCDYTSSRKYNYNRHLLKCKSNNNTHGDIKETTDEQNEQQSKYTCNICNKIYMSRNGLWKHKIKCKSTYNNHQYNEQTPETTHISNNINNITPEMILELIKNNTELIHENSDFKNIIIEQNNTINNLVKNGTNNNHINSHNKTFNLQVFLNETCKDAMNINDFVNSIQLQLADFERMGEVGYAQGISDIITNHLNALDVTQRPVHCTDKKRETMYVKEDNQWIKEDENKTKIKKMIKRIENKNIQIIPHFQKKYPNHANPKSHESDKYHKTIIEVMGGMGGSEGKQDKIIRNITKHTTIHK